MALKLESYYANIIMNQKNSIPWLNRLILKAVMANGVEDYYADYRFVLEYPRYLFRQDFEQKWTNERTSENICIFPKAATGGMTIRTQKLREIDGFEAYDFKNTVDLLETLLNYQYRFFNHVSDRISTEVKYSSAKNKKKVARRICFFDMAAVNTSVEEIVEVLTDIQKSDKNLAPLCAVYHQDESYEHVHFLYMLDSALTLSKKELKQIPHIENVIKEKYGV